MLWRYLHARWALGWALVWHVLGLVWRRRDPARWVDRLAQEQLGPTAARAWERHAASGRCIGCGLCDAAVGGVAPVSQWLQSLHRLPQDAVLHDDAQLAVLRQWAPRIAQVCPTRVDVLAMIDGIKANQAMLRSNPLRNTQPQNDVSAGGSS